MQEYSYINGVLPDFEYSKVKVCTQHRHENYCFVTGTSRSALSPSDVSNAGHSLIMSIDDQYLSLSVTSPSPFPGPFISMCGICVKTMSLLPPRSVLWGGSTHRRGRGGGVGVGWGLWSYNEMAFNNIICYL